MEHAGVDVGGTKCLGVVVDGAGVVLREERLTTPYGAEALLDVLDMLAAALAPYDSFGVGAAGLVSYDGVWRAAPNVGGVWDFPIKHMLSQRLGHAVAVDNDATCATLAEWQVGAGVGVADIVLVNLGTGIGGGVVAD